MATINTPATKQYVRSAFGSLGEVQYSSGNGNFLSSPYMTYSHPFLTLSEATDTSKTELGSENLDIHGITNSAKSPVLNFRTFRGTLSSTLPIVQNDFAGFIGFRGVRTAGSPAASTAAISVTATENWSASNSGSAMNFQWTLNGNNSQTTYASMRTSSTTSMPQFRFGDQQAEISGNTIAQFSTSSSNKRIYLTTGANATSQTSGFFVTSGNRQAELGLYRSTVNANSAGYIGIRQENNNDAFVWSDNSGIIRTSNLIDNVGTTGGTVVGSQVSDFRLKNSIQSLSAEASLNKVLNLNPVEFIYNFDVEGTLRLGFIAQELSCSVPEAVYDTKEKIDSSGVNKLAVSMDQIIPILVSAMQQQQFIIADLSTRLQAMENK